MNDDLEKLLGSVRLAPPSAELDRRMEELLASDTQARLATSRSLWWWLALPVVGTIAASLLLMSWHPVAPRPLPAVLCQIEAKGLMREWLLNPPSASRLPPKMTVSVQQ